MKHHLLKYKVDNKGCWVWTGMIENGYGRAYTGVGRQRRAAHRIFYESLVGPVPKDLQLDHLCRNRACVNPRHLEVVTSKENVLRGFGISALNARKTHCLNGHEFNINNTYIHPKRGTRLCNTCQHERVRRYRKRLALS